MDLRQGIEEALKHEETSKAPGDFGAIIITGILGSAVPKSRRRCDLNTKIIVKIVKLYQI